MYQSAFEYMLSRLKVMVKTVMVWSYGLQCCWEGGGDTLYGSGQNRVDVNIPAAGSCGLSLAGVERQPGDGRARAGTWGTCQTRECRRVHPPPGGAQSGRSLGWRRAAPGPGPEAEGGTVVAGAGASAAPLHIRHRDVKSVAQKKTDDTGVNEIGGRQALGRGWMEGRGRTVSSKTCETGYKGRAYDSNSIPPRLISTILYQHIFWGKDVTSFAKSYEVIILMSM